MTRRSLLLFFQTRPAWHQLGENANTPSRIGLQSGAAPTDTVVNGQSKDSVLYLDSTDGKLKRRGRDGTVVILG